MLLDKGVDLHSYQPNAAEDLVVGMPVSVQGSFDTYYEGKIQYCTLRNAELV